MTPGLNGKSVVITGSSRGIGLGLARSFASEGAVLTLIADDPAVMDRASEFGARGAVADITDGAAVDRALGGVSHVDVLVNNAGLELLTPIADGGTEVEDAFRRIIDINVVGTQIVTRRALPLMRAGGVILNTASIWGRTAEAGFGAYVASKHAVIGLTKTWAKELGPQGIRVNAVCPGWVRTETSMRSLAVMSARSGTPENELLAQITGGQALPGLMEPDDVAALYVFLASDHARNITGQSMGVDRGEVPW
jgi:3-hydroxybutyrate dehydrogenase